jgi:predicted transposase/invertase (TIGR01784 family)
MQAVASLRYGVIFKKAFSQPDVFTAFVRDILGIEIIIDHVETEKSFASPIGSIDNHFDLFAEDKVNRIIVDIQHRRYPDHYHRFLHYHCAALLEQAVNAKDYRPALAVYTIVVLTSGDKHGRDMTLIDFDPKDRHGQGLGEIPHKILYLTPKYLNDETPEPAREWLLAINDSLDEQVDETLYHKACVQKILTTIRKNTLTPAERARMKDEYSEEELRREEWEKAEQRGLEKGKREGRHEGKLETARLMLAEGMDINLISKLTGMNIDDISQAPKN